jgi:hypothetical protein
MANPIQFKLRYKSLAPYQDMVQAIAKIPNDEGSTFDLMVTPVKADGKPDTLVLEISREKSYGIVQITDGVEIIAGEGTPFLLASTYFDSLPAVESDEKITFTVDDRVYVAYPEIKDMMEELKFDFEYSDNLALFTRKETVQPAYTINQPTLKLLGTYLLAAASYADKKKSDSVTSLVKVTITPATKIMTVESTNTTDAFFAEIPLTVNFAPNTPVFEGLLHPTHWSSVLFIGEKTGTDVFIGMDQSQISIVSNNMVLTLSLMNLSGFPEIGTAIRGWIQNGPDAFNAIIDPLRLQERLKYIESIGLAARSYEPLFIMNNTNGQTLIRLKGYQSNGSSKLTDKAALNITWSANSHDIRLPARLLVQALSIAQQLGLTEFYDLQGLTSIFLSNPEKTCFILLAQEASE